ncbi:MAG TPA: F0F1 ATP synthase subunit B [Candidatus Paceibacterota bacterium]|nr:F0F1 ATP synthase subunit B [Candidatus Paceibacterota bacterium]
MEALDAFGIDWRLLAIQAVNFALLLWLLKRYLFTPLIGMLEKRQAEIAKGVANAARLEAEHAALEGEREQILRRSRDEANTIVEAARRTGEEKEREIVHAATERGAQVVSESQVRAREEYDHILAESQKEIAQIAILAAEKILRERPQGAAK